MTSATEEREEKRVISTHILTKRMTISQDKNWKTYQHFNSHPHEEDDPDDTISRMRGETFQLTSSRRG